MRPIHPGFGSLGDEGAALNPKKRLQTSPNSSIFQLKTMKKLQYKYIFKHILTISPVLLNPNHFFKGKIESTTTFQALKLYFLNSFWVKFAYNFTNIFIFLICFGQNSFKFTKNAANRFNFEDDFKLSNQSPGECLKPH